MVSYWKTQWFRFVLGCMYMLIALHYMFQDGKEVAFVAWAVGSLIFFISADLFWHRDCLQEHHKKLEELEGRLTLLEDHAITDIDKVSNNNYIVRRRLGPDRDVPYPEEEDD